MSKITRVLQKAFASTAATGQIGVFGSFANGSPATTTSPATVQSLANFLAGWFDAVEADNSPAIEDMNALFFLIFYQLTYLFQEGVAEWDAGTTYYKGSLANNGGGLVYGSLVDTSLNQPLTDATKWKALTGPAYDVMVGAAPYCTHPTLAAAVADSNVGTNVKVLLCDSALIGATINLTKAGWRIEALPGVSYTPTGGALTLFSCQAANIEISHLRFNSWSVGVTGTSAWTYGRILFCNFNACTNDIDTSSCLPGKIAVTLGNIDE